MLEQAIRLITTKPGKQIVALPIGRCAADEPTFDVVLFLEDSLDVLGVFNSRSEDQHGLPILRVLGDFLAGRFDQLVLIH